MPKNNTGKKVSVIRDELKIIGGGIYCYLPFERLDRYKKAVFKIGLAIDFNKRMEQYLTYFPLGLYMIAFLENPPVPRPTRSNKEVITKKSHYMKIEKFIFDAVEKKGGKRIFSTSRVKNLNDKNQGETEWIYSNEDTVHKAFVEGKDKFGGKLKIYYLEGLDPETNKFSSINDVAKANEQHQPNYTGKIIYRL